MPEVRFLTSSPSNPTIKIRFQQTIGGNPFDRLVRWIIRHKTGSQYTHCCFLLSSNRVCDATAKYGVVIRDDTDRHRKSIIVNTRIPEHEFLKWISPRLGMPFDFWGMVSLLFHRPMGFYGCYYCSNLIAEFLGQHTNKKMPLTPIGLYYAMPKI